MTKKSLKRIIAISLAWVITLSCLGCFDKNFPFEEDFEGEKVKIETPKGSSWGVVSSHAPWITFNGKNHLDNNLTGLKKPSSDSKNRLGAVTKEKIQIPPKVTKPILSFWYKAILGEQDAIYVDIIYLKDKKSKKETVDTVKVYQSKDNTDDFFKWESISLNAHRAYA